MLGLLCEEWAKYNRAEEELAEGDMVEDGHRDGKVKSPLVRISETQVKSLIVLFREFGMSPKSRKELMSIMPQGPETGKGKAKVPLRAPKSKGGGAK